MFKNDLSLSSEESSTDSIILFEKGIDVISLFRGFNLSIDAAKKFIIKYELIYPFRKLLFYKPDLKSVFNQDSVSYKSY